MRHTRDIMPTIPNIKVDKSIPDEVKKEIEVFISARVAIPYMIITIFITDSISTFVNNLIDFDSSSVTATTINMLIFRRQNTKNTLIKQLTILNLLLCNIVFILNILPTLLL